MAYVSIEFESEVLDGETIERHAENIIKCLSGKNLTLPMVDYILDCVKYQLKNRTRV